MSQGLEKNKEVSILEKPGSAPVNLPEEVKELTESIGEAVDLEGLDALTMGNVSDNLKKVSESGNGGSIKGGNSNSISVNTKNSKTPSPKLMKRDVENKIKEEITLLSSKANMLINKAHKQGNQFELVIIMRKLRKLRQLLNSLVKFSGDQIKNLWFRFVKGQGR